MSVAKQSVYAVYLQVAPADIALVKFVFESYEGVGVVRTMDPRVAIIVAIVVADFLPVAREIIRDLQARIACVEVCAPLIATDDWLMREIVGE
jgi:phosphoribosylformylglycinamidine (FGAM) synthase-like enzyme